MSFINKIMKISYGSSFSKVPVIDMAPYLQNSKNTEKISKQIRNACKTAGFFYIENHGVPQSLQNSITKNMEEFFKLPIQVKKKIDINNSGKSWKGYFSYGEEYTSNEIDHKEGIWYGRELDKYHPQVLKGTPFHGANPFLEELPQFRKDVLKWLKQMERVGNLLSQAVAESLELDRNFFKQNFCDDHLGTLGLMHYPPLQVKDESIWGVGEHTDYGFLTILKADSKGLEAKCRYNDSWIKIDPIPNTFVINIGDILQKLTKGLYKSTPHRARNVEEKSRFSIPYFFDTNWNTPLEELDIRIYPEEQKIIEQTKKYKRWDNKNIELVHGSFGPYVVKKLSKAFPNNIKQIFKEQLQ